MTVGTVTLPGPFELPPVSFDRFPRFAGNAIRQWCERVLRFPALNAIYRNTRQAAGIGTFCERALAVLRAHIDLPADSIARIPASGPLIVVANHPFGGLDGLVLAAVLNRARPDVRLMANYLLGRMPEMREMSFLVDPFGGETAHSRNRAALKSAVNWVRAGGALGVFPAGEVAHFTLRRRCVTDPAWDDSIARLVRLTGATVLPVFIDGQNSRLFQLAGMLHPRLRTALLPHELLRAQGQAVRVEIGKPIPFQRMARFFGAVDAMPPDRGSQTTQATEYLRLRTYILKGRNTSASRNGKVRETGSRGLKPVIDKLPAAEVTADVEGLPIRQCLSASGSLRVYYGTALQLPHVLREIGRLRELTFRAVGEGTGREIDLDRFDQTNLHLFVWNAQTQRIVGAYRMGQTDVLLKDSGAAGLYTSTLFRFRSRLLNQLTPALELGRSFVVSEYQRDHLPLMLLWKGIGRYVAQNPKYRLLFGAVSISDDYESMTKQLLMTFLRNHVLDVPRAALVHPRHPPRRRSFRDADENRLSLLVNSMAEVEELVNEIESGRRSVPVLLRQYFKLNARLLGFNIDAQFGNVLDGLVLVDLATVDLTILTRYMGRDAAAAFLAYHGIADNSTARASRARSARTPEKSPA